MKLLNFSITDLMAIFISFLALINSFFLLLATRTSIKDQKKFSEENIKIQKEHYLKSLQPMCNIRCINKSNEIFINLHNCGHGFLTINKIVISNKNNNTKYFNLHSVFPKNINLSYYSVDIDNCDIAVGDHIKLIEINNIKDDTQHKEIENVLSQYIISIEYCSVYGVVYNKEKDLSKIFGIKYREK